MITSNKQVWWERWNVRDVYDGEFAFTIHCFECICYTIIVTPMGLAWEGVAYVSHKHKMSEIENSSAVTWDSVIMFYKRDASRFNSLAHACYNSTTTDRDHTRMSVYLQPRTGTAAWCDTCNANIISSKILMIWTKKVHQHLRFALASFLKTLYQSLITEMLIYKC